MFLTINIPMVGIWGKLVFNISLAALNLAPVVITSSKMTIAFGLGFSNVLSNFNYPSDRGLLVLRLCQVTS
jgi:hypothetical protein